MCTARYQGFESLPIRFVILLLLVLLIVLDPARAAENDLAAAEHEYAGEKFDAALASLDRFEKSAAPTAVSLDLRGCIHLEQQKVEEAKKAFEDAHSADAALFAPRLHLGDLLLRQKKFTEARDTYRVLLKETNILTSSERLRFAILLSYLGEHDEASAEKAYRVITFPTQTPAYYFAQAAWAFAHNRKSDGDDWVNKSAKVFDRDTPLWFASHLYHFGWVKKKPPLLQAHN